MYELQNRNDYYVEHGDHPEAVGAEPEPEIDDEHQMIFGINRTYDDRPIFSDL